MTIEFIVPGDPQPKGSMRMFRKGSKTVLISANRRLKQYEYDVQVSAAEVFREAGELGPLPANHPVTISVEANFERPLSHFVSRKRGAELRNTAPAYWHTNKPDAAKILRAVEDALTGVVYDDDRQVCCEHISKRWGDESYTRIAVTW